MKRKYALLVSYRGTQYCGWQRQSGSAAAGFPSIQQTLEEAVRQVTQEPEAVVVGSGRTDSGVHAVGQVAHVVLERKEWDCGILRKGLTSALPQDIRVVAVRPVPIEFHAQRGAEKKQYSYYFQQGPTALPHLEPFSWWIQKPLLVDAMNHSVRALIGEHDFKPFQAAGAKPGPTVRKILEAEVSWMPCAFPGLPLLGATAEFEPTAPFPRVPLGLVRFRVVGTGFLKQMVRSLAGTLLQIGEGRRPADAFESILRSGDRSSVGPTSPARALWLEQVWYPGIEF